MEAEAREQGVREDPVLGLSSVLDLLSSSLGGVREQRGLRGHTPPPTLLPPPVKGEGRYLPGVGDWLAGL